MFRLLATILFISAISLMGFEVYSQQLNFSLEFFSNQQLNLQINQSNQIIHTGFKPVVLSKFAEIHIADSLEYIESRDRIIPKKIKSGWIYRKLRNENFVDLKTEDFKLKINPLFNLELKYDDDGTEKMFVNTRGIELKGDIGNKIYFYSSFHENQARYEPYVTDYIKYNLVVPGQGAPKFLKNNKFDFSRATAYLYFRMGNYLNLQFGHSKQFIGEGYRSVLLSDNAFNYPFIKLTGTFGQFQYLIQWSQHELFEGAYYIRHFRKYNALSYLSWANKKGLEISLFESVEWPGNLPDIDNFSINFFNPVMFWRTIQYGLNGEKNLILGLNAKLRLYDYAQTYGQFALDRIGSEIKANNNYAFQVGIKHFDLFHENLSRHKLFAQLEYNHVAPYTYAHFDVIQSYTHYNQPLAHPAGSGLKEALGILSYSYKDFNFRVIGSYMVNSIDTAGTNFGSDVLMPDRYYEELISHVGNKPGQGIKNTLLKINSELIFLINPSANTQVFAQLVYRKLSNSLIKKEDMIFSFGLRTNLNNYYYDF